MKFVYYDNLNKEAKEAFDNGDSSGNVKIIVFGDRNWKNTEHIKHIRYVSPDRILLK